MKRVRTSIILLVAVAALGHCGFSAEPESSPVNLDFKSAPLREVLSTILKEANVSFLIDPSVPEDRTASVRLDEVPIDQALDLVCGTAGLAWRRQGGVYVVTAAPGAQVGWFSSAGSPAAYFRVALPVPHSRQKSAIGQTVESLSQINIEMPEISEALRTLPSLTQGLVEANVDENLRASLFFLGDALGSRSRFQCPDCNRQVTLLEGKSTCKKCSTPLRGEWSYCPKDGEKKTSTLDDWKVCPFCRKNVAGRLDLRMATAGAQVVRRLGALPRVRNATGGVAALAHGFSVGDHAVMMGAEQRSTFSCASCKKSVTIVGEPSSCASCHMQLMTNWQFCPRDGTRRAAPTADWKACPFCDKEAR